MRIDPFDIIWVDTDPLGREVVLLHSVVDKRKNAHPSAEEHLPIEKIRDIVTDPDRIDISSSIPTRDVYYKREPEYPYPYARAVVDFRHDENKGHPISWSRYEYPVSSSGVRWEKK